MPLPGFLAPYAAALAPYAVLVEAYRAEFNLAVGCLVLAVFATWRLLGHASYLKARSLLFDRAESLSSTRLPFGGYGFRIVQTYVMAGIVMGAALVATYSLYKDSMRQQQTWCAGHGMCGKAKARA